MVSREHPRVHVLVVDDEPQIVATLMSVLKRHPARPVVHAAATAREARSHLEREPVDLLIVDYRISDGTGLDVLAFAERTRPEARRALMTGYVDVPGASESTIAALVHTRLSKPWENADLHATVDAAIAARSAA